MSGVDPNPEQRDLIEATDGLYLVNAGAGTGRRSPLPGDTQTLSPKMASIPKTCCW